MPTPDDIRFLIALIPPVLLLFVFTKPYIAVIGYMVLVFCKTQEYYPVFTLIQSELSFAVIILLRLLFKFTDKSNKEKFTHQISKTFFLFSIAVAISFAISIDKEWSWNVGFYPFIKIILLYIFILLSIDDNKQLKVFFICFMAMYVYLTYEPAYNYLFKVGGETHYFGDIYIAEHGILSGHVALANNVNQMLPFFILIPLVEKQFLKKAIYYIPAIILFVALIGSGSRGGVAGFVFCGLLLAFYTERRKLGFGIVAAFIVILLLSPSFQYTASRFEFQSESATGRFTGFVHGVKMFLKGNLLGVGPGCFALGRSKYFQYRLDSHNIYGQVIGELGIPGTVMWLLLIYRILVKLSEIKKRYQQHGDEQKFFYLLCLGLQISILVRLFISIASHGLYFYYWYLVAALTIMLDLNSKKLSEKVEEKEEKPVSKFYGIVEPTRRIN